MCRRSKRKKFLFRVVEPLAPELSSGRFRRQVTEAPMLAFILSFLLHRRPRPASPKFKHDYGRTTYLYHS